MSWDTAGALHERAVLGDFQQRPIRQAYAVLDAQAVQVQTFLRHLGVSMCSEEMITVRHSWSPRTL